MKGYDFKASEEEFAEMVSGTARSELDKTDVALFMRKWARKS